MTPIEETLARATEALEKGEDETGARYLAAAAGLAMDAEHPGAGALYGQAAQHFWRADRPRDALNSLHLALSLPGKRSGKDVLRIQLAGVLTTIGRMDAARQHLEQVTGWMSLDSLCSVALAQGDRIALDAAIAALETHDAEPARWALALRVAMRCRLDGELDAAEVALQIEVPARGEGIFLAERAEIALLRADSEAASLFAAAAECFADTGRRSLQLQAEAARVRALLDLGLSPISQLSPDWAERREMTLLALDLRRIRARLQNDRTTLRQCCEQALGMGLRPRAARAALWAGTMADLQQAIELYAGDRPHQLLARVAHAEALAEVSAAAGCNVAKGLLAEAEQLGMEGARERLLTIGR